MRNESNNEPTQNAYPQGRWSSPAVKVELLRYAIQADEIRFAAVDRLVKQQAAELGLPEITISRRIGS